MSRQMLVRGFTLDIPEDHRLPGIQSAVPSYDKLHDQIFEIIGKNYPTRFFVDVGANVGDTAGIMRRNAPNPIICVEGSPSFLPYLKHNVEVIGGDIRVIDRFLFNETLQTLNLKYACSTGSGGFQSAPSEAEMLDELSVKTIALGDLLTQQDLSTEAIALFKTDTDGADAFIIEEVLNLGFKDTILFFECDPAHTVGDAIGQLKWQNAFISMCRNGYSFIVFDNFGLPFAFLERDVNIGIFDCTDYILNQYQLQHLHVHYLDIWAFPQNRERIFCEVCSAYRGQNLRKYLERESPR